MFRSAQICQLRNKQSRLWTKNHLASSSKQSSRKWGRSMHTDVELDSFDDSDVDQLEPEDSENGREIAGKWQFSCVSLTLAVVRVDLCVCVCVCV